MTVGEKLTEARKRAKLTQEQLAEKLSVSPQAISLWERDATLPDTGHLAALAKTLDISLDRLLGEDIPRNWTLHPHTFSAEHMYTYLKAKAQAEGLTQTLAALPFMREKHAGAVRKDRTGTIPYAVHPLTLACHTMAMGLADDDVVAAALLHDVVEDTDTTPEELPAGPRVREAVRLVSYNTYDGTREEVNPVLYANIAKNPLAALIKCLDRCHNISCMADGFSKRKMAVYVTETEKYVMPLLDVLRETPEYNNAAWLLRYQILTMVETFKRLL